MSSFDLMLAAPAADAGAALDVGRRHEVEDTLATARLVVALVYASLAGPFGRPLGAFGPVVLGYVAYAAVLHLAARRPAGLGPAARVAVHGIDLLVPLAVGFAAPQSGQLARGWYAALSLYLVPLVHAALSWGPGVTLATTVIAVIAALGSARMAGAATFVADDAAGAILIAGSLLAFVGLLEQRRAAHAAAIARLREACRQAHGFKASLRLVLGELASWCRARGARVTVRHAATGDGVRWEYSAARLDQALSCVDLPPDARADPAESGRLAAAFDVGDWTGRVEIVEPADRVGTRAIRSLERAVHELAPEVHRAYVQARIRSRARKDERAQLARELHMGPIQSLIGAEMSLEALKRRIEMDGTSGAFGAHVAHAQRILREEILVLRELMVRMKPLELPTGELPTYLAQVVRRFSRESGIRGTFVADDQSSLPLPPHRAVAFARIVHEALANVRKHSGATRVVVSLHVSLDRTRLIVDDDGRGFDPQQPGLRPEMIGDTVRALGGTLTIDSVPGHGARLQIVAPSASPARAAAALKRVAS